MVSPGVYRSFLFWRPTGLPYSDAPEYIFCEKKTNRDYLMIYLLTIIMSEKRRSTMQNNPKTAASKSKIRIVFVPNSGFLCVPNLLCSILEEDFVWKSGLLPVKTNKQT